MSLKRLTKLSISVGLMILYYFQYLQFLKTLSQIGHDQFINHDLPALKKYKENLHLKQSKCAEDFFSLLKGQQ